MGAVCVTLRIAEKLEYEQSLHCCKIVSEALVEYKVLLSIFFLSLDVVLLPLDRKKRRD